MCKYVRHNILIVESIRVEYCFSNKSVESYFRALIAPPPQLVTARTYWRRGYCIVDRRIVKTYYSA